MIEPKTNIKDVIVGGTLVNVDNGEEFPVRVLNLSNSVRILRKGTPITKSSNMEAVVSCEMKVRENNNKAIESDIDIAGMIQQFSQRLTASERQRVACLMKKYATIFVTEESRKGKSSPVKHHIDTGDAKPIRQQPRSVPLAKRDEVNSRIEEMHRNSVIEPSSSPWSSPVVVVKKRNGSIWFCIE